MNTLEKVAQKLDEAQDLDDVDLHLIPMFPPALVRAALRFIAKRLPDDSAEMEEHVRRAIEFLEDLLPDVPEGSLPEHSGTLQLESPEPGPE